MKIVLTTHQFLPEYSAGTEVLTYETAKELQRRGHEVDVWTGFPADPATAVKMPVTRYEYNGLPVYRYNHSYKVPLGGKDVLEYEYDNHLFAGHFMEYAKKVRPDIVHPFHMMRLSASLIAVCRELDISVVFTPTDFWTICPTCQLRLEDNSLCTGPDFLSVNCLRHIVEISQPEMIKKKVRSMSYLLLSMIILVSRIPRLFRKNQNLSHVRAVSRRKKFIVSLLNEVDRILAPTMFMQTILVKNGVDQKKIRFIPYGLNLAPFENQPAKEPHSRVRIGFMGTLYEHKGAHVLLEAVGLLPKDFPVEVKIYGKTDEFPDYVAKLKGLAASDKRVELLGNFPNDQIGKVFSGLDVLVVPSIWYENTPLVIYSAHASGTPVIATNLGGMSEVVRHEKDGLLFEKGDSKGLSLLIKRLVDEKGLLEGLAKNITSPRSISGYVDELEKTYNEILAIRSKQS